MSGNSFACNASELSLASGPADSKSGGIPPFL
jgi:hypothetical protein